MNFSTHPLMIAHLARHPNDNDVRQAARVLDSFVVDGMRGLSVGDLDEPFGCIAADLGLPFVGIDLRLWNNGYWDIPEHVVAPYPRIVGDLLNVQNALLRAESFDYVVATSSIEHFGSAEFGGVQDPMGDVWAMRKIHELLKPGGRAVITVPVKKTWHQDMYWRGYTRDALQERIVGPFQMELLELWWTSIRGNEQAQPMDWEEYDSSCDLSALLVLKRVAP